MTSTSNSNGKGAPAVPAVPEEANGRFRQQFWKTEMCRFWRSGCRNAKMCPFAHGEQELCGRPDLCKTSLCQRWAKGACPLDANECRFAHGRLDLRATPNFMHGLKDGEEGQAGPETEGALLGPSGNDSGNPNGALVSGAAQPAPQFWEEQDQAYMNGGAAGWGNRDQGNHGNAGGEAMLDQMQAALGQRDWQQWSPEYGDGLQDGDGNFKRRNRRARDPKTTPSVVNGSAPGSAGAIGTGNNGRPLMPHQQMQAMMQGGQNGEQQPQENWSPATGSGWPDGMHQASHATSNGTPQQMQGPQQILHLLNGCHNGQNGGQGPQEPQQQWVQQPSSNGWLVSGLEAKDFQPGQNFATYTGHDQGYNQQMEVLAFPNAITAPDTNIMNPTVPQEVRAIWS